MYCKFVVTSWNSGKKNKKSEILQETDTRDGQYLEIVKSLVVLSHPQETGVGRIKWLHQRLSATVVNARRTPNVDGAKTVERKGYS